MCHRLVWSKASIIGILVDFQWAHNDYGVVSMLRFKVCFSSCSHHKSSSHLRRRGHRQIEQRSARQGGELGVAEDDADLQLSGLADPYNFASKSEFRIRDRSERVPGSLVMYWKSTESN